MIYKQTTQVPNIFFDHLLPTLTEAEIKLLLVIIRKTYGWVDKCIGHHKSKDRISQSQFVVKTGLCKCISSKGLQSLVSKDLISIYDQTGKPLLSPLERKGVSRIYYSFRLAHFVPPTSAQNVPSIEHKSALYKTNYTKLTIQN
jgi:hypothetical protein